MKILKLNRRYVLGKAGFEYAIRFPNDNAQASAIRKVLHEMYGNGWNRYWRKESDLAWGYYRSWKRSDRTYWIGVRNEADLTAAILMAQL